MEPDYGADDREEVFDVEDMFLTITNDGKAYKIIEKMDVYCRENGVVCSDFISLVYSDLADLMGFDACKTKGDLIVDLCDKLADYYSREIECLKPQPKAEKEAEEEIPISSTESIKKSDLDEAFLEYKTYSQSRTSEQVALYADMIKESNLCEEIYLDKNRTGASGECVLPHQVWDESEIEIKRENTVDSRKPFQTINYVYGQDIKSMSETDFLAAINKIEKEIETLEAVKVKSKRITASIDLLKEQLAEVVEAYDTAE